jgi:hypothetical protein
LVAEANIAFALNMRLFEELDVLANVPGATVRPLSEALRYAVHHTDDNNDGSTTTDNNNSSSWDGPNQHRNQKEIPKECPFAKMGQLNSNNSSSSSSTSTTHVAAKGVHQKRPDDTTAQKEIPKECPFAKMGQLNSSSSSSSKSTTHAAAKVVHQERQDDTTAAIVTTTTTTPSKSRCPWPFIVFHDPIMALYDWQTWAMMGIILCYLWNLLVMRS